MKTMKRIVAVMMTVLMLVGTVSVGMTSTAASKKVTKIKLNKSSVTVYVGETYSLKATVSPSNASNKKVTWSSSDKKVATVSSSGKVTAKKAGKVTITVKAKDGSGKKATCKVTVKKPTKVTKIKLNKSSVKLNVGKTLTLKATVSPSNATNKNVSWSSSNKSVATVSSKGKITAKKAGTATITCKAKDGSGKKATVKVTVTKKTVKVTSVDLDRNALSLNLGKTYTLTADISPSSASNKAVTWKSSDDSVATVSSSGKVTAVSVGTATITATVKDGSGEKDTCRVTVKPVLVTGISLSRTFYEGQIGARFTLTATVSPSNATNKKVTWTSSDTSVATVDSNGNVRLIGSGEATIEAEAVDASGETASCQVVVEDVMVSAIQLSQTSYIGVKGNAFNIYATVSPSNATNKNIVWQSSNSSVAMVNAGNVVLLNPGTAQITAMAADGSGKMATCIVTVDTTEVKSITLSATELIGTPGGISDTLVATVSPSYASNQKIVWTSEDEGVAKVDNYGEVTYVGIGKTNIVATAADGYGAVAKCSIEVVDKILATSITLSTTAISGKVGHAQTITATALPKKASQKFNWSSSDTSVATVDANGYVKLVGGGTAVITATATDGSGVSASCTVTSQAMATEVTVYTAVSSWYNGKTGQVMAYVSPKGASQNVTWTLSTSDNKKYPASEYVKIDKSGNLSVFKQPKEKYYNILSGKYEDTNFNTDLDVTVTATAKDGSGVKGSYKFTIKEKVAVTGVAFSSDDTYSTYVGQEITPSVKVSPDDASEKGVEYTSSNTSVIKIENGKIVAVGAGNATVTVKSTDNPSKTDTLNFSVQKPELYLMPKIGETNEIHSVGETITVQAIWQPADVIYDLGMKVVISDESVLKHISTENYADNSSYLKFELLKEGTATVTITTNDGKISSNKFPVEVKGVVVDDYHDGISAGQTVTLTPEIKTTEDKYFDNSQMECIVPEKYAEYFSVTETRTGVYKVEILKELPAGGAYLTIVPYPETQPEFTKNVYFSAYKYETVSQENALQAMKNYTQTAASAKATRDKAVNYNDINVIDAEVEMSSDNLLTNLLIQSSMKDMTPEELGASDMVYFVFGEPENTLGEPVSSGPLAISVNENEIKSVEVIDDGGVTYQLVMTLGSQSKMGISSIGTSTYAKAMPVINANSVSSFKSLLSQSMSTSSSEFGMKEVNEGTVEQAYRDGKVVLTINKLTDKIEKCDYYFVSDMKLTNTNLDVYVDAGGSFGKINMNTIATFTMSVEEKISFYDLTY